MSFFHFLWLLYYSVNALKAIITVKSISYWPEDDRISFFESLEYSDVSTLNELPRILGSIVRSNIILPSLRRDFEKIKLDKWQCTSLVDYFLNKPEYHRLVLPFSMVYSNPELISLIRPYIVLYRPTELKLLKTASRETIFSHDEMIHYLTLLGSHPEYCQDNIIEDLFLSFSEFTLPWEIMEFNSADFDNYPLMPETSVFRVIMEYSSDKSDIAPFYGEKCYEHFDIFDKHFYYLKKGSCDLFDSWKFLSEYLGRVMSQWKLSEYRQTWWQCRLTLTVIKLTTDLIKPTNSLLVKRHYCNGIFKIFLQFMNSLKEEFPQYLIEEMILLIRSWNILYEPLIPANVLEKLIHILTELNIPLVGCKNLEVSLASWRINIRLDRELKHFYGGFDPLDISRVISINEFLNRWASFDQLSSQIIRQPQFRNPLTFEDSEGLLHVFYEMNALLEFLTLYYWNVLRIHDISKKESLTWEEKWLVRGFGRLLASNLYYRGHFGIAFHHLQEDNQKFIPFADNDYLDFIDPSVEWPFRGDSCGYKILNQLLYKDLKIDGFFALDTLRAAHLSNTWQKFIQVVTNPLTFILFFCCLLFTVL